MNADYIRQQVLQEALTRIEQEAREKSMAIIAKADILAAAHALCARVNVLLSACDPITPSIVYYDLTKDCDVVIHTHGAGSRLLLLFDALGFDWAVTDPAFPGVWETRTNEAKGVLILVGIDELHRYAEHGIEERGHE